MLARLSADDGTELGVCEAVHCGGARDLLLERRCTARNEGCGGRALLRRSSSSAGVAAEQLEPQLQVTRGRGWGGRVRARRGHAVKCALNTETSQRLCESGCCGTAPRDICRELLCRIQDGVARTVVQVCVPQLF